MPGSFSVLVVLERIGFGLVVTTSVPPPLGMEFTGRSYVCSETFVVVVFVTWPTNRREHRIDSTIQTSKVPNNVGLANETFGINFRLLELSFLQGCCNATWIVLLL